MECPSGKEKRYSTEEEALDALRRLNRNNPRRKESRVYPCSLCFGWHLTSQEKKVRK